MFARLRLTLAEVEDAVAVPETAVLHHESKPSRVVIVAEDGTVAIEPVKTGIEDGSRVQILAGVEAGQRVAVAGHGRLRPGMKVRIAGKKKNKQKKGPAQPPGSAEKQ